MKKFLCSLTTTAFCIAVGAGCTTPYGTPKFDAEHEKHKTFRGIAQLLKDSPKGTLDVLMVHGMCTHDRTAAVGAIENLHKMLGAAGKPIVTDGIVQGTKISLHRADIRLSSGIVRTSALVWSPVVEPLKKQLCYDQSNRAHSPNGASKCDARPYPYKRALANKKAKDWLLNDCLADAIIYQGKSRDAISEQIQKAIITAIASLSSQSDKNSPLAIAAAETTPLVFITDSLGSKMSFDAIVRLSKDGRTAKAASQTLERTSQVFMFANQMPLLALAEQGIDGSRSNDYPVDSLAYAMSNRRRGVAALGIPTPLVVGFTDPNDLLSYPLVSATKTEDYDFVDVIVSNAFTWLWIAENPYTAHVGYIGSPAVQRLVVCGSSGTCP